MLVEPVNSLPEDCEFCVNTDNRRRVAPRTTLRKSRAPHDFTRRNTLETSNLRSNFLRLTVCHTAQSRAGSHSSMAKSWSVVFAESGVFYVLRPSIHPSRSLRMQICRRSSPSARGTRLARPPSPLSALQSHCVCPCGGGSACGSHRRLHCACGGRQTGGGTIRRACIHACNGMEAAASKSQPGPPCYRPPIVLSAPVHLTSSSQCLHVRHVAQCVGVSHRFVGAACLYHS